MQNVSPSSAQQQRSIKQQQLYQSYSLFLLLSSLSTTTMAANLRFTASKCPAQEDATCELPFGFLWSPFRDDDDEDALATTTTTKEQQEQVLMDLCPTCLAYRNVYCTATSSSSSQQQQQQQNDEWTCPFCQFTVVGTTTGAATTPPPPPPNSTTTTTTVVYRQPVSTAALPAVPTLLLVLDAHLPAAQVQAIGALVESVVQEESKRQQPLKIGLIVFDAVVSVYQLPTANGLASCQEFYDYASTNSTTTTTDGDVLTDETPYLWTVTPPDDETASSSSLDPLWTCLQARFGCSRLHNNDNDNDNDASSNNNNNNNNQKNLSRLEQLKRKKAARLRGTGASIVAVVQ